MSNNQTLINNYSLEDSIFKIGKVVAVRGRSIQIKVDKVKNLSHLLYKGELIKNVSVGGYVKIIKGFTKIIGKVEGEYVDEEKQFSQKKYGSEKEKICRILNVSLLGFFSEKGFERGIKELPLIDNECYLLENREFNKVHDFVKDNDIPITIGFLSLEKGQKIKIGVNSLFASHIGIFGNTGSGKSYTLAKIYRELFLLFGTKDKFRKNGQFIIFDFNGEYSCEKCIVEEKRVYNLTTRKAIEDIDNNEKFPLSEKDLLDLELLSILANATEKTQKPFLSRTLEFYNKITSSTDPITHFRNTLRKRIKDVLRMTDKDKANTLIDYFTSILRRPGVDLGEEIRSTIEWNNKNNHFMPRGGECRELLEEEIEELVLYTEANEYEFPQNILTKIIHFLYFQLIFDVYYDKAQNEHIAPAIQKLKSKRIDIEKVLDTSGEQKNVFNNNNFVIINFKNVNLEMRKTLPLILAKKLYTEHKLRRKEDNEKFLNIIIDEAHNILSTESFREAESWKDYRLETFEEIIKEGRKFGVFMTIASQRPSDISPTIISQLHNFFLHRLINNNDIVAIERSVSYLDKISFELLPILPTGTCILAGLTVQIPVVVDIGVIEPKVHEPDNKTMGLIKNWI